MAAKSAVKVRGELPLRAQVGDRIRVKEDWRARIEAACKAAGYDGFNPEEVHTVERVDPFNPGGGPTPVRCVAAVRLQRPAGDVGVGRRPAERRARADHSGARVAAVTKRPWE